MTIPTDFGFETPACSFTLLPGGSGKFDVFGEPVQERIHLNEWNF